MIELAQQVGELLDLSTGKTGDHREEQAVRRDGTEPFCPVRRPSSLTSSVNSARAPRILIS
jgi:hypothetical protein